MRRRRKDRSLGSTSNTSWRECKRAFNAGYQIPPIILASAAKRYAK